MTWGPRLFLIYECCYVTTLLAESVVEIKKLKTYVIITFLACCWGSGWIQVLLFWKHSLLSPDSYLQRWWHLKNQQTTTKPQTQRRCLSEAKSVKSIRGGTHIRGSVHCSGKIHNYCFVSQNNVNVTSVKMFVLNSKQTRTSLSWFLYICVLNCSSWA